MIKSNSIATKRHSSCVAVDMLPQLSRPSTSTNLRYRKHKNSHEISKEVFLNQIHALIDKNSSPGLSSLTHKANQEALSKTYKLQTQEKKIPVCPDKQIRRRSHEEFTALLSKLDKISNHHAEVKRIALEKEVRLEFLLEKNAVQVFKITTKDMKCPLKVYVNTLWGKVVSHATKIANESLDQSKQVRFTKGYLEISDTTAVFKTDYVHISVEAKFDSHFSILCLFGKREELPFKDESFHERSKSLKSPPLKDFVQINIQSSFNPASPSNYGSKWEMRKKSCDEKRKKNIDLKKERKEYFANRKVIKLKIKEEEAARAQFKLKFNQELKQVFSVMYLLSFARGVFDMISFLRYSTLKKLRMAISCRKIQRYFRQNYGSCQYSSLVVSQNNLIFSLHSYKLQKPYNRSSKVIRFIQDASFSFSVSRACSNFIDKVLLIQHAWCKLKIKEKSYHFKIERLWMKTIGMLIERYSKSKRTVKRRRSLKYIDITKHKKDLTIGKFMEQQKIERIEDLKNGLPLLYKLPSEKEMKDIINNAIKHES